MASGQANSKLTVVTVRGDFEEIVLLLFVDAPLLLRDLPLSEV